MTQLGKPNNMNHQFVLLTAAKDEEEHIGAAIDSVLRQSRRPLAWFIVDDGSTDRTAQIVETRAREYPFIRLHRLIHTGQRGFDSKDKAINLAYDFARQLDFAFVGIQDADIAPAEDRYYETILAEFGADEELGIAGGYILEKHRGNWSNRIANSPDSVAGGVQMFRRECYDQIGGYIPLRFGGEDWLAQIDAKMHGWSVRALPNCPVYHYRTTSSAGGRVRGLFRQGMMDASFGSSAVFELLKCARRTWDRPVLVGSVVRLLGFLNWKASRRQPVLPPEKVAFLRAEQMSKARRWRSTRR